MAIRSVLFGTHEMPDGVDRLAEPEYFQDLNLDQIVQSVCAANPDSGLAPYFRLPVRDVRLVAFRQQVFQDLENPEVLAVVQRFAAAMAWMRRRLDLLSRMKHPPQAHRWFLRIVLDYAAAVVGLAEGLRAAPVSAAGLLALRDDLAEHARGPGFAALAGQAGALRDTLGEIRYDMFLRGDKVTVAHHDPDSRPDFAERVLDTFARFRGDQGADDSRDPAADLGLDHVEASVLDLVVRLHPRVFEEVAAFGEANRGFVDDQVVRVDRELRFYLGYLAYLAPLREAGLPTCYPRVTTAEKGHYAREVYDLALAVKLTARGERVVGNDIQLTDTERVLVVSGPNQGGKTTLSRTFGQLHHLAALGCPVPGREARVFLPDRIFTHYERAESLDSLASKLDDELLRMRAILEQATPDSLIILNEIFTSTTSEGARTLSRAVLAHIDKLDALCLWVSFIDELSRLGPRTVSMVSIMAEDSLTARSYKVVRKPADGRAYAIALAEKHGLTYAQLTGRAAR